MITIPKSSGVPDNWPSTGIIEFRNVKLKYKTSVDYVLKDLSFTIPGGYKVGVVGRSGAGKSSLIAAILR